MHPLFFGLQNRKKWHHNVKSIGKCCLLYTDTGNNSQMKICICFLKPDCANSQSLDNQMHPKFLSPWAFILCLIKMWNSTSCFCISIIHTKLPESHTSDSTILRISVKLSFTISLLYLLLLNKQQLAISWHGEASICKSVKSLAIFN